MPENTMSDTMKSIVKIDEQGRIYLPKELRNTIKERVFKVKEEKGKLIFEPVHVAQEGRGIFKVETSIRDIDEKIEEYTREAVRGELY
jgi:bifunctional DNA-binding transcriptional regulator/antitoxin component of YhaV-PrlF toxin-antitoxin module